MQKKYSFSGSALLVGNKIVFKFSYTEREEVEKKEAEKKEVERKEIEKKEDEKKEDEKMDMPVNGLKRKASDDSSSLASTPLRIDDEEDDDDTDTNEKNKVRKDFSYEMTLPQENADVKDDVVSDLPLKEEREKEANDMRVVKALLEEHVRNINAEIEANAENSKRLKT